MSSYRSGVPQVTDPLEHIYKLERELDMSEKRTASMIEDLARRLQQLETRMSAVTEGLDRSSRKLEREIVALSDRLASLEGDKAA
jgi:predicted  nucleic acid-binding Zn-ribbon protein